MPPSSGLLGLKMKVLHLSITFVSAYQLSCFDNPRDHSHNTDCHENLKIYYVVCLWFM
jgi:hypothetical protein